MSDGAPGYVYRIIAPGSYSVYVGQSANPLSRFREHKQRPGNPHLANFLRKHSDAEIYFWPVLDMDAEEIADEAECRALGLNLLNCTPCGGRPPSRKGKAHSAEARAKLSAALTGRNRSSEHRANLSASLIGRNLGPNHRAKISAVQTGKKRGPFSPEHCANISSAKKGKKHGPEQRKNMSTAHKGVPWSDVRRAAYERGLI